jgi:prepilin-type N-terminal cleavage/methylation domain-containing protein
MKKQNGFSIIELLIVASLLLIVLGSVYFMIIHYREVSETELSRIKLQQESRFMLSSFASELKSAGAVLTLANTGSFLSALPYFNGIYPLNNTNFPDGIIVAIGNPDVVTTLTQSYNPSSGNIIPVENTADIYGNPLWVAGDKGIIIGPSIDPADPSKTIGYYVFAVDDSSPPTANTITMRTEAVYYSRLLSTTHYTDVEDGSHTDVGNNVAYPINSPVIKLSDFSIYLVKEIFDADLHRNIRQLIRVSDAKNQADVLADTTTAVVSVISENIWDMQISYAAYPSFPVATPKNQYFAGGSSSTILTNLLLDIRSKYLKEISIDIVALTDEFGGKGERTLSVPVIGDRASSYNLPEGKFGYRIYKISIEPRNFNIVI